MGNKSKVSRRIKRGDIFKLANGLFLKVTKINKTIDGTWYSVKPLFIEDEPYGVYGEYFSSKHMKKVKLNRLEKLLLKLLL
jgi:hypothetical protein